VANTCRELLELSIKLLILKLLVMLVMSREGLKSLNPCHFPVSGLKRYHNVLVCFWPVSKI